MDKKPVTETRSEQIAAGVKAAGMAGGIMRLIRNLTGLVVLSALMLLLISWGIPKWFCLLVIFMMAAFVGLDIISLKKTAQVNLKEMNEPEPVEILLEPQEEPVIWIPGVMRAWKTRSTAVLGTGKVLTPENALLITNKNIWALTVPLPGVDQVVSSTDIGKLQWLTAWRDIDEKLQQMLAQYSPKETLAECRAKKLGSLNQIKTIKYSDFTQGITIKLQGSKSYTYSIRDKDLFLKAQKAFPPQ